MKTKFYNLPKQEEIQDHGYCPTCDVFYRDIHSCSGKPTVKQTPTSSFYKELERKEKRMKEMIDRKVTKV